MACLRAQTTKLIHDHIVVSGISTDMEEMVLNAEVIDDLMNKKDPKQAQKVLKILIARLDKHKGMLVFKELSERLEAVRDKAERGLINSIEFIKELCQIAKETLQAEKQYETTEQRKTAKGALTELFREMKTDKTPAIVERIVNDIDEIVRIVRFDGWQNSSVGEREVKKNCGKFFGQNTSSKTRSFSIRHMNTSKSIINITGILSERKSCNVIRLLPMFLIRHLRGNYNAATSR